MRKHLERNRKDKVGKDDQIVGDSSKLTKRFYVIRESAPVLSRAVLLKVDMPYRAFVGNTVSLT